MHSVHCHAVIVAGGVGNRFQQQLPKQFTDLNGQPVLLFSIQQFLELQGLRQLVIVSHPDWMEKSCEILDGTAPGLVQCKVVAGGRFRQTSVYNGIKALHFQPRDIVFIHDAARPLVTPALIQRILNAATTVGAAVPVLPAVDSLVELENGLINRYLRRDSVSKVQTPQAFKAEIIQTAHALALQNGIENAPDDGFLVQHAGYPVAGVPGDPRNLKITRWEDMEIVRNHLDTMKKEPMFSL